MRKGFLVLIVCLLVGLTGHVFGQIPISDFEVEAAGADGWSKAWGDAIQEIEWFPDPTGESDGVLSFFCDGAIGDNKGAFARQNIKTYWTSQSDTGATGIAYDVYIPGDFPETAVLKAWGQDMSNWGWAEQQYRLTDGSLVADEWNTVAFNFLPAIAAGGFEPWKADFKGGIEFYFGPGSTFLGEIYVDNIRMLGVDPVWVVDDFENPDLGTGSISYLYGDARVAEMQTDDPSGESAGVMEIELDGNTTDHKAAYGAETILTSSEQNVKAYSFDVWLPADVPDGTYIQVFAQDKVNWTWNSAGFSVGDASSVPHETWVTLSINIENIVATNANFKWDNGVKGGIEFLIPEGSGWSGFVYIDNFTKVGVSAPKGALEAPGSVTVTYDAFDPENPDNTGYIIEWSDLSDDLGETYSVYASPKPIDENAGAEVIQVATKVPRGTGYWNHKVYSLNGASKAMYFAVTASGVNPATGDFEETPKETASAGPVDGATTVSPNIPFFENGFTDFYLDADITDFQITYENLGVSGFKPRIGDDETEADSTDLFYEAYLIMDKENLYIGAFVTDDDPLSSTGQAWQEGLEFFISFYDVSKTTALHNLGTVNDSKTGDYRIGFTPKNTVELNGGQVWDPLPSGFEYVVSLEPGGYLIEAVIPFASMRGGEDGKSTFEPAEGMFVPLRIDGNDMDSGDDTRSNIRSLLGVSNTENWMRPSCWGWAVVGMPDVSSVQDAIGIPEVTQLRNNYPNPFNPSTSIAFDLSEATDVKIQIFNISGQLVRTLADGNHAPGRYLLMWNGANDAGALLGSGTYFVKMSTPQYHRSMKVMFVK